MNLRTAILLVYLCLAFILFSSISSFSQVKNTGTVSISGFIERINENHDVIHVKGMRIVIPPKTKRVDENGNVFKESLKQNLYVEIEAIKNQGDLLAQKIMVRSQRRGLK